jgi:hypothetical protein
VGAIFVRAYPDSAAITLNGKPVPNQSGIFSGIFGGGTLISDLFPRTYSLALSAQGYDAWHENVSVLPSFVTELKYAVLVPQAANPVAGVAPSGTAPTAQNFWLAGGEPIMETPTGAIVWQGKTIGYGTVVAESADITEAVVKNAADTYSLYYFNNGSSTALSAIFAANGVSSASVTNIVVNPGDANEIVVGTNTRISLFDTAAGTFTAIDRAPAGTTLGVPLAASAGALAWTRGTTGGAGTSTVVVYDRFAQTIATSTSGLPGRTIQLAWVKPGLLGVLQSNGALYLYDTGSGQFQKLADTVTYFAATSDGSLIAALERASLEIFSFTSTQTYHRFNLPDAADATQVAWYGDADHLFVDYPNHVAFLDLDDLTLANFTTVANLAAATTPLYDAATNILYFLNPAHALVRMNFPS